VDWTDIISSVAFPIAVAGYLLVKVNKTMENLTKAINRVVEELARHNLSH